MDNIEVFHLANIRLPIEKNRLLLIFVGLNLFVTGIDVALAHSINSFIPVYEWIPIYYFPIGAMSCFIIALQVTPKRTFALIHISLMTIGLMVGFLGTAFHMNAVLNPLGHLSWAWLVFGSPILAPLAFSGISLLGLYAITEEVKDSSGILKIHGLGTFHAPISRDKHFLWLVGLGFGASAITSIIDHAQYGYNPYKLIAIVFGLFATSVVLTIAFSNKWSKKDELVYFWTMIAAIIVGVMGFGFHLSGDLAGTGKISLERMLVFAPILAPLLYGDLGMLGLIVVAQQKKPDRK
ncbi:MAG: hypothetical protein WAM24_23300 [Ignavibacteriaceae bacterium]